MCPGKHFGAVYIFHVVLFPGLLCHWRFLSSWVLKVCMSFYECSTVVPVICSWISVISPVGNHRALQVATDFWFQYVHWHLHTVATGPLSTKLSQIHQNVWAFYSPFHLTSQNYLSFISLLTSLSIIIFILRRDRRNQRWKKQYLIMLESRCWIQLSHTECTK